MQLNPILALELRARWRNNRSFLLLLLVGLALIVLGFVFYEAALYNGGQDVAGRVRAGNTLANAIGRTLFMLLAPVNILAWLFIATASAAPAIARERERGLLESLQLSHVSARGQIGARLLANLALLGVLQLVLTPVYALAFLMGGLSPLEVGTAFYLVAWSAVLGSAFGLWFSARAHRPTGALFSALGLMAAWAAAVYVYSYGGNTNYFSGWHLLHPSAFFAALSDPNFDWTMQWGGSPLLCLLAVSAIWAVLCAALLWSAARQVARTLPTAAWRSGSAWVEKLRHRQAVSVARAPQSRVQQKASGALLAEVPLDRFVNFANPLLAREVKGRFRVRRVGWGLSLVRGALFVSVCLVWLAELYWLFDDQWRATMVPYALLMLLMVGMACLGVIAATSWTRERESGTWEALQLSLLQPGEIVRAKWLSPLVSFAYYSAPLWILLPIGALFFGPAISLLGALIVAAWWGVTVALGLWISWRVRSGTAAIAWTAGLLAALMTGSNYLVDSAVNVISSAGYVYGISQLEALAIPDDEAIDWNQVYQKETGRDAPKPTDGYDERFQQWVESYSIRQIREREWKADAAMWHPLIAITRLGSTTDENFGDFNSYLYYGFNQRPELTPHIGPLALVSLLFPGALIWILLALSRRALKRELRSAG